MSLVRERSGPMVRGWDAAQVLEGHRSQFFWNMGGIGGWVEQFESNAPTTYAYTHMRRLGAFSSWDDARRAVERSVPFVDGENNGNDLAR